MNKLTKIIQAVLEALAVGDALGMPTEFMTQKDIDRIYPKIYTLLDPQRSYTHPELSFASVTDDTEQNLYLIRAYLAEGTITVENSARALSRWVVECDAIAKKYIGPSSLKALKAIEEGVSPMEAGRDGTTDGGIMRTPALVLCAGDSSEEELLRCIRMGCIPTHNTSQAIEAAAGYGFALHTALRGGDRKEIIQAAYRGAEAGLASMDYVAAAPSCIRRLRQLEKDVTLDMERDHLRDDLYALYGTGLPSVDAFAAVMAVFLYAGRDVFEALRLSASLGGDTDTIGALAGALCAAYAGGHNIPEDMIRQVTEHNCLDLAPLSVAIQEQFWS